MTEPLALALALALNVAAVCPPGEETVGGRPDGPSAGPVVHRPDGNAPSPFEAVTPTAGAAARPPSRGTPVDPLALPPPRGTPADPWFAEDKAKHFFMSFALTGFAYGAARSVGLDPDAALAAASGGVAVAGVGKELHDRRTGGVFSARDLAWNVVGIAAGLVLASNTR